MLVPLENIELTLLLVHQDPGNRIRCELKLHADHGGGRGLIFFSHRETHIAETACDVAITFVSFK